MDQRRAILISNPRTGRYGSRRPPQIAAVSDFLRTHNFAVEVKTTTGPGDATHMAATAAANGVSEIIVSGGDGTINEAVQGLIGSNTRLGILPTGTGNVLARELKIPLNTREAAAVIARGRTRTIYPACVVDDRTDARRYFLLMAGIGLDAAVIQ